MDLTNDTLNNILPFKIISQQILAASNDKDNLLNLLLSDSFFVIVKNMVDYIDNFDINKLQCLSGTDKTTFCKNGDIVNEELIRLEKALIIFEKYKEILKKLSLVVFKNSRELFTYCEMDAEKIDRLTRIEAILKNLSGIENQYDCSAEYLKVINNYKNIKIILSVIISFLILILCGLIIYINTRK